MDEIVVCQLQTLRDRNQGGAAMTDAIPVFSPGASGLVADIP
jgi:hypothetical protein